MNSLRPKAVWPGLRAWLSLPVPEQWVPVRKRSNVNRVDKLM